MNAEDIVRRLAANEPTYYADEGHVCGICEVFVAIRPAEHQKDCSWRLAKEWVAHHTPHVDEVDQEGLPRP